MQRAKKPSRVPLVFTRDEVKEILAQLTHTNWLMASLGVVGHGRNVIRGEKRSVREMLSRRASLCWYAVNPNIGLGCSCSGQQTPHKQFKLDKTLVDWVSARVYD